MMILAQHHNFYYAPITDPPGLVRSVSTVTAYSEFDSCHYDDCVMASGKRAYVGAVACPRALPLGSPILISGRPFTCEDRTAKKYDGRFDIFLGYGAPAHEEAKQFGVRKLLVEIIK